jgi:hypothetical protein
VDKWKGDDVSAEFSAFNDKNYAAFSQIMNMSSNEACAFFANDSIDLLHIDGNHTYDVVRQDFESWLPKLSKRAVVLFHNTNVRRGDFGVWRFFDELKQSVPYFEFLHSAGLGVAAIGPDAPVAIMDLCRLTKDSEVAIVRERFAQVGSIWTDVNARHVEIRELAARLGKAERAAAEKQAEVDVLATRIKQLQREVPKKQADAKNPAVAPGRRRETVVQRDERPSLIKRLALHKSGKPRGWVRAILFDGSTPKPIFSRIVLHKSGKPRSTFSKWLAAESNNALGYDRRGEAGTSEPTARSLIRNNDARWSPLPVYRDRRIPPTLTILTDSTDAASLFGGVGTAIVVGVLAAKRLGMRVRLATRSDAADPSAFGDILRAHKVDWNGPTDFAFVPIDSDRPLSIGNDDLILTTSWWTTLSALGSIDPSRLLYLLQEDERMFYPFGDTRLRCAETLSAAKVRVLVNTELLFEHLSGGDEPLADLRRRGAWFDPAFPAIAGIKREIRTGGKKNFFFYARPNHERNLFWRGLEVVDQALREGVLTAENWDFYFVGGELPAFILSGGVVPNTIAKLPWTEYASLVKSMDLGLCLMDTPHPSYSSLDLAAGGSIVVTNAHGHKRSLDRWSRNIIAVPPTVSDLVAALRAGVALSCDDEVRSKNFEDQNIPVDWENQLKPAFDKIFG